MTDSKELCLQDLRREMNNAVVQVDGLSNMLHRAFRCAVFLEEGGSQVQSFQIVKMVQLATDLETMIREAVKEVKG
jgi:hypothetical protein